MMIFGIFALIVTTGQYLIMLEKQSNPTMGNFAMSVKQRKEIMIVNRGNLLILNSIEISLLINKKGKIIEFKNIF